MGLPQGTYRVYVTSIESRFTARSFQVGIGVNPGSSQFANPVVVGPPGELASWVSADSPEGGQSNYVVRDVTVAAGDYPAVIVPHHSGDSPEIYSV